MLYQHTTLFGQYLWMISTVFCFGAANTATHVYASELFPTEIRATGYAWTTNLTGRITEVITPAAIGVLIFWLGIANSIAVVAIGPVLGALLVLRYAPETRGLTLEEIQESLDPVNVFVDLTTPDGQVYWADAPSIEYSVDEGGFSASGSMTVKRSAIFSPFAMNGGTRVLRPVSHTASFS